MEPEAVVTSARTARCCTCKTEKLVHEFHAARGMKDGVQNRCKDCYKIAYRAGRKRWQSRHRLYKYKLSSDELDRIFAEQSGKCAICRRELLKEPGDRRKSAHIDHDHATGAVRGLLCMNCNLGIGSLMESAELLDSAAAYLRKHK